MEDARLLFDYPVQDRNNAPGDAVTKRDARGRSALRLVMLPHEAHGYRAKESILHMLWEQDRWLETYVKNAKARAAAGK